MVRTDPTWPRDAKFWGQTLVDGNKPTFHPSKSWSQSIRTQPLLDIPRKALDHRNGGFEVIEGALDRPIHDREVESDGADWE